MTSDQQITGLISGGLMGSDPFDPTSWSGSSKGFFEACQRAGLLGQALGPDIPKWQFALQALPKFHPDREVWRRRVFKSVRYRHSLEKVLARQLGSTDSAATIVQLGAYVNARTVMGPTAKLLTYQDGNAAEYARSPFVPEKLKQDKALHADCIAYERQLAQDADMVLTTSDYLGRSFVNDYGVAPEKVATIGCGMNVPLPDMVPARNFASPKLLFIGKEFSRKGGDVLVKAFADVKRHFADAELHLVGPSELPGALAAQEGVVCHGFLKWTDPDQLAQLQALYSTCSLFVQPTRYEPFGIAPLEAMGFGMPALVTGAWALAENIKDGVTGAHCAQGVTADQLAAQIISLLEDPAALATMGAAARADVAGRFTWNQVVSRLQAYL